MHNNWQGMTRTLLNMCIDHMAKKNKKKKKKMKKEKRKEKP